MCPFVYSRGYWICRCRRQVMTRVTNSFTTATRSISARSECKFVKSAGETNRQMQHVERTEFVFIDGLLSWYLQSSAVWISSLAYRSRGVRFCHAVKGACFPLKLLLLIFLSVSRVFSFVAPTHFSRSDESFIDFDLQKRLCSAAKFKRCTFEKLDLVFQPLCDETCHVHSEDWDESQRHTAASSGYKRSYLEDLRSRLLDCLKPVLQRRDGKCF